MPFGLKNAGPTYQKMMIGMFREKISHTVEMYIDDMVVKSKEDYGHVSDLVDIFEVLRRHRLHLKSDKCVFGMGAGKFLDYMITHRGIEVNPEGGASVDWYVGSIKLVCFKVY